MDLEGTRFNPTREGRAATVNWGPQMGFESRHRLSCVLTDGKEGAGWGDELCVASRRGGGPQPFSGECGVQQEKPSLFYFIVFILFFWAALHSTRNFPDQGSNPRPLQWKHGVLTAGPPGKSIFLFFFF